MSHDSVVSATTFLSLSVAVCGSITSFCWVESYENSTQGYLGSLECFYTMCVCVCTCMHICSCMCIHFEYTHFSKVLEHMCENQKETSGVSGCHSFCLRQGLSTFASLVLHSRHQIVICCPVTFWESFLSIFHCHTGLFSRGLRNQ